MDIKVGDKVQGQVTGVTKYGVFVKINDDYTGMVHISEVSDEFVTNIASLFNIGDVINVKVLGINEKKSQVKLSLKKLDFKVKTKHKKLRESGAGFETLKQKLDDWTQLKMKEINVKIK